MLTIKTKVDDKKVHGRASVTLPASVWGVPVSHTHSAVCPDGANLKTYLSTVKFHLQCLSSDRTLKITKLLTKLAFTGSGVCSTLACVLTSILIVVYVCDISLYRVLKSCAKIKSFFISWNRQHAKRDQLNQPQEPNSDYRVCVDHGSKNTNILPQLSDSGSFLHLSESAGGSEVT